MARYRGRRTGRRKQRQHLVGRDDRGKTKARVSRSFFGSGRFIRGGTSMIVSRLEGSCMTLTINRPERRNALTGSMYQALDQGLQAAQADPACHAVILTGAGDCFTAGNDLSEFQATRSLTDSPALAFLRTLANVDVPVIAAVEGHAVGVGVTLLQHCDFVYAGETAQFSMPFVSLGLCPEGGSSTLLAQLVGARRANEWLLLGRRFDAT